MSNHMLANLRSGFFIALIALPLCLGIAIASSFPPVAGLITAIVGGLVVSLIGGCQLSIKGPAAGLIVIVLASVTDLGGGDLALGYKRTLAVGVFAAVLQIIFALLKTARFGRLMPPSVIHGMLAAIGIIIVAKQIHILVGAIPHGHTTFELLYEIPASIMSINPELAFIGIFTLILMLLMPLISNRLIKSIPPALLALMVVIPLGLFWHLDKSHIYRFFDHDFKVGPEFLVNIPNSILGSLAWPDFSILTSLAAYKYVLMLALVGSVESVLTVIAIDAISNKEKSDLDRDLLGVGVGNLLCSLIGGLPMISEVVRSKANIDSGATSRASNFFHGAFLLLAISLLAPIIKEIPLAALAAMLMVTGMRLASVGQFSHAYKVGLDQFLLFIATLITTLATDLLIGIIAGVIIKALLHTIRGVKINELFTIKFTAITETNCLKLCINSPAIFTNYLSLQKAIINALKTADLVEINLSQARLIDHTTLSCLESLKKELGNNKIIITGLDQLNPVSNHQLATHRLA